MAGIARRIGARSQILGTARVVVRPASIRKHSRPTASLPAGRQDEAMPDSSVLPGPVETKVRELGATSPRLLCRASGVDLLARQVITEAADARSQPGRSRSARPARKPRAGGRGGASAVGREGSARSQANGAQTEPEAEP
jgi:hypothetical protein